MKKNSYPDVPNPSAVPIHGQPENAWELVNKYGTYEIQPTADTADLFPAIAQGVTPELVEQIQKAQPAPEGLSGAAESKPQNSH